MRVRTTPGCRMEAIRGRGAREKRASAVGGGGAPVLGWPMVGVSQREALEGGMGRHCIHLEKYNNEKA